MRSSHANYIGGALTDTDGSESLSYQLSNLSNGSSIVVGGTNSKGTTGYIGPCPPVGDSSHHYIIQLYALDLAADALPAGLTRAQLMEKIKGHVLKNSSVVRRYHR